MNKKQFLIVSLVTLLALLFGAGHVSAQDPHPAAPQSALGQGFTYQGQLKDSGGNPITDTCNFKFSLWDDASGGVQAGAESTVPALVVTAGYFTAQVNASGEFGSQAFTGQARWLQIAVQCGVDAGYTTLTPRQSLAAAPYALSLKPGAYISEALSYGNGLTVENTATSSGYGIVGSSFSPDGSGIFGANLATTGYANGVQGTTDSTSSGTYSNSAVSSASGLVGMVSPTTPGSFSAGVVGLNKGTAGLGIGVWGKQAGSGYGVYGTTASGFGVVGRTDSTSPASGAGVWAYGGGTTGGAALLMSNGSMRVQGAGEGTNTPVFIHTVDNGVGGNFCPGFTYITVIDNPYTNGDPNAILIVTPNAGPASIGVDPANAPVGVFYDDNNICGFGPRWAIFTLGHINTTNYSKYNVMVIKP